MISLKPYHDPTTMAVDRSFAFQATRAATEWSEEVRRMEHGRYRFSFAPYQREMMEAPYDPRVQMVVYMLASRLGKTEVVMNMIGHAIDELPRRILTLYPTTSQAEKWSKETFEQELCEPTPALQFLVRGGRRNSANTILHKLFPGGLLNIFGANSPGEMRRAKGNFLFADEIDALQSSEADEGDQLEIFWVRGSEYRDTIKVAASYPSLAGHSRISALMDGSDYRKWFKECPRCGEAVVLLREHIEWPTGEPEKAWVNCPECKEPITDDERREMVRGGEWRATRDFSGVAGFWGNGMMSPHPVQKGFASHLHWVAVQQLKAEAAANPERARRVLVNTFDALPFQATLEEKPDAEGLLGRREDYRPNEKLPGGVLAITWGADVQKDRIEVEIVGHGRNEETWGLAYKVVQGSPLKSETWRAFEEVIGTAFEHPQLGTMKARGGCIDSRYQSARVRRWTRAKQGRGIYAIVGSTVLGKPPVSKPKREGSPPVIIYELGTHELKDVIYQRLELYPEEEETQAPQGMMHFPATEEYQEVYFKGLLAEDSVMKKASDGDFYRFFTCPKGVRNEPLDCRVYAMAAEQIARPNYAVLARKAREADGEDAPVAKPRAKKKVRRARFKVSGM